MGPRRRPLHASEPVRVDPGAAANALGEAVRIGLELAPEHLLLGDAWLDRDDELGRRRPVPAPQGVVQPALARLDAPVGKEVKGGGLLRIACAAPVAAQKAHPEVQVAHPWQAGVPVAEPLEVVAAVDDGARAEALTPA